MIAGLLRQHMVECVCVCPTGHHMLLAICGSHSGTCGFQHMRMCVTANEAQSMWRTCMVHTSLGVSKLLCEQNEQTLESGPSNRTVVCHHSQAGIVSLEAVMGHLAPADDAMAAAARDAAAALAREIRGIGVISLSATAAEPVRTQLQ